MPLTYEAYRDRTSHRHDGFYLNYAIGGDSTTGAVTADPEPEGTPDSRVTGGGIASQILVGGTPAPGLVVGGGSYSVVLPRAVLKTDGTRVSHDVVTLSSLGPFVAYYVDPRRGSPSSSSMA